MYCFFNDVCSYDNNYFFIVKTILIISVRRSNYNYNLELLRVTNFIKKLYMIYFKYAMVQFFFCEILVFCV